MSETVKKYQYIMKYRLKTPLNISKFRVIKTESSIEFLVEKTFDGICATTNIEIETARIRRQKMKYFKGVLLLRENKHG